MPPPQAQALYLTPMERASGVSMKVDLASGPVTVRVPPVWHGKLLNIRTPNGDSFFRVRVFRTIGGRVRQLLGAFVVFLAVMTGPLIIVAGATAASADLGVIPTCNGRVMSPGATCEIDTYDGVKLDAAYFSFSQMQRRDSADRSATISAGIVVTVVEAVVGAGAGALYVRWRNKPLFLPAKPVRANGG